MKKILKNTIGALILRYYKAAARLQVKKGLYDCVVGITGTVGKSSTMEMCRLVLESSGKSVKYSKKANSESGIPLNILGIEVSNYSFLFWIKTLFLIPIKLVINWDKYDYYLVEMGMDSYWKPRNIQYLIEIIKPNIGILTRITQAHSENFVKKGEILDDNEILERIKSQKKLIVTSLDDSDIAIINSSDENSKSFINEIKAQSLKVSLDINNEDDVQLVSYESSNDGTHYVFKVRNGDELSIKCVDLLGKSLASNFAQAIALGISQQIGIKKIEKALCSYRPPVGRGRKFEGKISQTTILDYSYNGVNFEALRNSIESSLSSKPARHRSVAILGDMRELGEVATETEHNKLANYLKENVDFVILSGANMYKYVLEELDSDKVVFYSTTREIIRDLPRLIQPKDHIVIQSSQNTLYFEMITKELISNNYNFANELPRQSAYWQKVKKRYR